MALRNIINTSDETLFKKSRPVTEFNPRLHELLDDMRETLAASGGLGLAAPQVGVLRRAVIVVNDDEEMIELVNPEIVETEGEEENYEGCLSVPGQFGLVTRPWYVKVKAQDRFGNWFEADGEDYTARCFCHEIDHLDGHIFTELCDELITEEELIEIRRAEAEEDAED